MPYEIRESKITGKYRYRINGDNGENMCVSQMYAKESNAKRGFFDLIEEGMRILEDEGKLKSTLERMGYDCVKKSVVED